MALAATEEIKQLVRPPPPPGTATVLYPPNCTMIAMHTTSVLHVDAFNIIAVIKFFVARSSVFNNL